MTCNVAEMEERGRRRSVGPHVVCQVKLFLHFILLAPYLFNCLSASLLGYMGKLLACVSVYVCVQQLPKYRGRQLAVLRAVGGMFKPQSAGDSV